ncbi:hypothetical protein D3C77_538090 [compost metagenome]
MKVCEVLGGEIAPMLGDQPGPESHDIGLREFPYALLPGIRLHDVGDVAVILVCGRGYRVAALTTFGLADIQPHINGLGHSHVFFC